MNKILFLNTGWMDFYKGVDNDKISGGGKHIDIYGWGGEILNFKRFQNKNYGYVQPKIDRKNNSDSIIKLERMGASSTSQKLKGVTVVWTAKEPNKGGTYVVGWYKNATVYRECQSPTKSSGRIWKGRKLGYYIEADSKNCKLLPKDERVIRVRRKEKDWMGQSNVWYADKNPEFIKVVQNYIFKGILPKTRKAEKRGLPRQSNPMKRIEVERKAINLVCKHYEKNGYKVESFEKDNVGWDLTATRDKISLKLEVKGLSGKEISTEVTPNEFRNLNADTKLYRLCIVTETLNKPSLTIFAYSNDNGKWTNEDGDMTLEFQKIISARIFVK